MNRRLLIPLAAGLLCTPALFPQSPSPEPINIGSRRELFVDDYLVGSMDGVRLQLQRPQSAGKAIAFDKPWEGNTSIYVTVLEDKAFEDERRYRMYYRGSSDPDYVIQSMVRADEPVPKEHPQLTAYAQSKDGITWTKPPLGIYEFNGSKQNSIVWMGEGGHNFAPFKDTNPASPDSERYKALAGGPLLALKSADGLHWEKMRDEPVITDGKFDSQNVPFWDEVRGHYVAVYRDFRHGVRTIKTATSKDFIHWTPGEWADYGDAPPENLYTNATIPYFRAPHIYLAFPKRFMPFRTKVDDEKNNGLSDGVFMSSRDGVHWHRFIEGFIRPGRDERNWVHRTNAVSRGVVATAPDEISLYVSRNYTYPTAHIERMTLRTDGFVAVTAGYPGGELITKPLIFKGERLYLNYATSGAGSIRIEIQNEKGQALPGFSLEDSPVLYGDEIDGEVVWPRPGTRTDRTPLRNVTGQVVKIRFVMRDADLFALRFGK
ncbi:MAG: hypothetical protein O2968_07835 [Acidobacteria bacterium]|nr:hypothetical protein [Acidobacteriota bacterium]